jgi:hypothetical protein
MAGSTATPHRGGFQVKIGFTGTAEGMTPEQVLAVCGYLDLYQGNGPFEFHHGMCEGADTEFDLYVREGYGSQVQYSLIGHPGVTASGHAWKRGGPFPITKVLPEKGYIDRDHDIVEATEFMLACPKEMNVRRKDRYKTWTPIRSGTWATIRYAEMRKKKVIIFWPDGTVTEGR